jgi:hypothetical protein
VFNPWVSLPPPTFQPFCNLGIAALHLFSAKFVFRRFLQSTVCCIFNWSLSPVGISDGVRSLSPAVFVLCNRSSPWSMCAGKSVLYSEGSRGWSCLRVLAVYGAFTTASWKNSAVRFAMSVSSRGTNREPLNGFSWYLILGSSTKIDKHSHFS